MEKIQYLVPILQSWLLIALKKIESNQEINSTTSTMTYLFLYPCDLCSLLLLWITCSCSCLKLISPVYSLDLTRSYSLKNTSTLTSLTLSSIFIVPDWFNPANMNTYCDTNHIKNKMTTPLTQYLSPAVLPILCSFIQLFEKVM